MSKIKNLKEERELQKPNAETREGGGGRGSGRSSKRVRDEIIDKANSKFDFNVKDFYILIGENLT